MDCTCNICGDFDEPVIYDLGYPFPIAVKRSCEIPAVPEITELTPRPGQLPPFEL